MADFCKQCSISVFGSDFGDLAGLSQDGKHAEVICEGCGFINVDNDGVCQGGPDCLENHSSTELKKRK